VPSTPLGLLGQMALSQIVASVGVEKSGNRNRESENRGG